MPSRVKPASHTHLARFASKPVPRAYVPKKARSRAAGRAEPLTSQDSLAAEVLLSLCPSGYREHSSDVGDGAVDSAAPMAEESESEQRQTETVEPVLQAEQVLHMCLVSEIGKSATDCRPRHVVMAQCLQAFQLHRGECNCRFEPACGLAESA